MVNDNGDDDVDGKSLDNIKNRRHHQLSGRLRLKRPQPWPRVQGGLSENIVPYGAPELIESFPNKNGHRSP